MSDFRAVGPLYCETPSVPDGAYDLFALFPLEPVNTLTSLVPAVIGVYLLWYLYRRQLLINELTLLATATLVVGVGSALWHGLRTETALTLDWIPGFVAFIIFTFLWPLYLKNRWWAYGTIAGIFLATYALTPIVQNIVPSNGPPVALFAVVALAALVLLYFTWRIAGAAAWWGVGVFIFALSAAVSQTIDLETCGTLPGFGTHAFWHVGLGLAVLCGTMMLLRIKAKRSESELNHQSTVVS